jgi:hypothetical protein
VDKPKQAIVCIFFSLSICALLSGKVSKKLSQEEIENSKKNPKPPEGGYEILLI